jgi:hypothetical protein
VRQFEPLINQTQTVKSVGDPLGTKLLIFVLSVIAGNVHEIGFLGLGRSRPILFSGNNRSFRGLSVSEQNGCQQSEPWRGSCRLARRRLGARCFPFQIGQLRCAVQ